MKVVILTHNAERHFYFANRIIEKTGMVVGVITGAKKSQRKPGKRKSKKKKQTKALRNKFFNAVFYVSGRNLSKEKEREELAVFQGSRELFHSKYRELLLAQVGPEHQSVNDRYFVEIIRKSKPDVIVIMGTCLVRKAIIESAPHVINLHTGLSPYYRGGNTNLWPIIEDECGYFGVTIHKISLGIDSGDIIHTVRPEIYPDDNFGRINTRCIQIGTDRMIQTIQNIENGTMKAAKQWTKGKLFFDRDMNDYIAYKYFRKRKSFFMRYSQMVQEGILPTVRLIENGEG